MGKILRLLPATLRRTFAHDGPSAAKAAAFSSILSFFPGLLVVASLLFGRNAESVVRDFSNLLGAVLPPQAYRLAAQYLTAEGYETTGLLAAGWFVTIWAASGVMVSLMHGFHAAYGIRVNRSYLRERLVALSLVALTGVPLVFATLVIFFGRQIEYWLMAHFGVASGGILWAGRLARWAIALLTGTTVIAMTYYVAPKRRQRWRYVWPGAALSTLVWLPVTAFFAWYAQNIARYRDLYGGISATVVLLLWMYLVNLIVLVGCEFNAEYETRSHGAGR